MTEPVCRKPWSEACLKRRRHEHPYTLGRAGFRQCHCGSRAWKITLGVPLGPLVACSRCGKDNRTATAYEQGREDGKRVVSDEPQASF